MPLPCLSDDFRLTGVALNIPIFAWYHRVSSRRRLSAKRSILI